MNESFSAAMRPKVLLVDDDEVGMLLTSTALHAHGFDVVQANSGQRAIKLLAGALPDVVLLDAVMPEMDGFDVCRKMRAMPGTATIPVLMLTGLDDDLSISRAYEAGATDFIVKSTQWSLLARRLRYLLRASGTRLELERSNARLAKAQDLARVGSVEWRVGQALPECSTEALRAMGLGAGPCPSLRALLRMVAREERGFVLRQFKENLPRGRSVNINLGLVLPDGKRRALHAELEADVDAQGRLQGCSGIVQDVTDRRVAEDRIHHLANFDSLTGLPNRSQLIWRVDRALEHARRLDHKVGILSIDLDRFQLFNDTLGHAAGDDLLLEVARRLRACVRHCDQVDTISLACAQSRAHPTLEAVARLGGDEFIALLPEVADEAEAEAVGQRILQALHAPVFVGSQECFVSASVGIALYPRDGMQVPDLIRNADLAMHAVKAQGRNAVTAYRPALAGKGRERLEMESALHKAVERNELVLHYQPKLDLRTLRMVGLEALMRWQCGNVLVPPGEFIPPSIRSPRYSTLRPKTSAFRRTA